MTGCIGQCQCRQIVTANMTTEVEASIATPVLEVGVLGEPLVVGAAGILCVGQSGLTDIGCEQTIDIILQQHLDIQIHGCLHRSVEECYFFQVKMLGIEF